MKVDEHIRQAVWALTPVYPTSTLEMHDADCEALSNTIIAIFEDRTAELTKIVTELAEGDPAPFDREDGCWWCGARSWQQSAISKHKPDCLWRKATELLKGGGS